jgi:hypothetical protein
MEFLQRFSKALAEIASEARVIEPHLQESYHLGKL